MRSDAEWARLFYGLLNEARTLVREAERGKAINKDAKLWDAVTERSLRDYREDRTKGKTA